MYVFYPHRRLHRIYLAVLVGICILGGSAVIRAQAPQPDPAACANPNPRRAIISQDLIGYHNSLVDGSFEGNETEVVLLDAFDTSLERAAVTRTEAAARTGNLGYEVVANAQQGLEFTVKAYVDKGETTRFSIWARSQTGPAQVRPLIFWVQRDDELSRPDIFPPVSVGTVWTPIAVEAETTQGVRYALFGLEIGPNTTLHLDDTQVDFPLWPLAEYEIGTSRDVGGIAVPTEPAAPVHISFLIHIEDPALITQQTGYFQEKTAVFRALADMFHQHGGFLTIQPEEDWVLAAENGFHPGLLAELVADYGVMYSTHTHGPNCRDDRGRLRSAADCNTHREWDRDLTDDDVILYVQNLRDLISQASGQPVTDHNGNFTYLTASRFAEIPMQTWSAYKNFNIQRTYDWLIINPWRPGEGNANANIEQFVTYNPATNIIYLPGWSQALTKHPDRALLKARHMLSQVIYHADPDRVNTFYFVLHVDHFYSRTNDRAYLAYDAQTGQVTPSAEFAQHIGQWEAVLTELVDPLVAEGYLQWTSLPDMGALYLDWEAACQGE